MLGCCSVESFKQGSFMPSTEAAEDGAASAVSVTVSSPPKRVG